MVKKVLTKESIVYEDGFGSYGTNALGKYYIATVADKIYIAKIGNLFFGALTIDYPFINDILIEVEVRRRAEFKSAFNMLMRKKFDKYHKKQYSDLISTIEYNFIQTVAMARKLRAFKAIPFNIPNKSTFTADNIIDKIHLRCKNINVKIQIKIAIKENSGKEKFCARIEIAFFLVVFEAIPNTRLVIYHEQLLPKIWQEMMQII